MKHVAQDIVKLAKVYLAKLFSTVGADLITIIGTTNVEPETKFLHFRTA